MNFMKPSLPVDSWFALGWKEYLLANQGAKLLNFGQPWNTIAEKNESENQNQNQNQSKTYMRIRV